MKDLPGGNRVFLCFFAAFVALAYARCWTNLPWCDEGWFFDTVYNLLTKGHTGTTVLVAKGFPWEGIERYQYWQPPLFWIIDGAWLKIFGLSLVAYRSLSVVAGVSLLFCWFWIMRHFEVPRSVQLLAMAILCTDYAVVKAGSDGRMDMLAASLGLAGVTVYLKLRENHFTWAVVLSQILICCGGLTHPMGGIPYMIMFGWFFVSGKDWRRVRWIHLPLAAAPYMIGAAGWGAYILQDPETFKRIFLGSNVKGRMDGVFNPFLAVRNEVVYRYLEPFGLRATFWVVKSKLLIPAVYLCVALAVWATPSLRREKWLRPFLTMWTIAALTLLFFDAQRNGTYMVHVFPLYGILLASFAYWLWSRAGTLPRCLIGAVLTGFVLLQISGSAYLIATNPLRRQYQPVVEFVKQHAKPGDRVVGSGELGFGLGFDGLYDDKALGYYVNQRPDLIVVSKRYREWFEYIRKPEPEVYSFVMSRLDEFQPAFHTDAFEVYLPRR